MKKGNKVRGTNANKVKTAVITAIFVLSIFSVLAPFSIVQTAPIPGHWFRGNVTVDGFSAPNGSIISAKIGGAEYANTTVSSGKYGADGNFYVPGDDPDTDEKEGGVDDDTITFWVDGVQGGSATFSSGANSFLDLSVSDTYAPSVTNPSASPGEIVANGVDSTTLNVTVKDHFPGEKPSAGIESVTVDLSGIGGDAAKAMTKIEGTNIYSTTTTAAEGTTPGTYNLRVNATDKSGNSNTSVNITLVVTSPNTAPWWDTIPDQTIAEDTNLTLNLSGYVHDNETAIENLTLDIVHWDSTNFSSCTINESHYLIAQPKPDWNGLSSSFQVNATDEGN
ncbi:hypothetical protein DRN97_12350, partial [Methanosarcinales archaeon]